jgi:hypothetical protein
LQAIAKALGVTDTDLLSAEYVSRGGDTNADFEMRDTGDGLAWLRINQAVPWDVALKISQMLKGAKSD